MKHDIKIAFFGSSQMSTYALDELVRAGFTPALVVTTPDKPQGRGLELAPNALKAWALERSLPVLDDQSKLAGDFDVFIVASYGRILPASIVFMPAHKTLNIHPSLLPRYRGAAPLQQSILDDAKHTGVTVMRLDEKMDHGPIIAEKPIDIAEWPTYEAFEEMMAREGGRLVAAILPDWVAGTIPEREQDHSQATFTKKIHKEDAELDLSAATAFSGETGYENFRKIQAYHQWPQAWFTAYKKGAAGEPLRVKAIAASFSAGSLAIETVRPQGSRDMSWRDFVQGYSLRPQSD
jgi:methionyl-tRNA formyltransferase